MWLVFLPICVVVEVQSGQQLRLGQVLVYWSKTRLLVFDAHAGAANIETGAIRIVEPDRTYTLLRLGGLDSSLPPRRLVGRGVWVRIVVLNHVCEVFLGVLLCAGVVLAH